MDVFFWWAVFAAIVAALAMFGSDDDGWSGGS